MNRWDMIAHLTYGSALKDKIITTEYLKALLGESMGSNSYFNYVSLVRLKNHLRLSVHVPECLAALKASKGAARLRNAQSNFFVSGMTPKHFT